MTTEFDVEQLLKELENNTITFHFRSENDIFQEALKSFKERRYPASAALCSTLYEQIFTSRLLMETSNPPGFVPSKENVGQQLRNLKEREFEITNDKKMKFRQITSELADRGVISNVDKQHYDDVYAKYRNPVAHGLRYRLYQEAFGKDPQHPFDIDSNYEIIYWNAAERLIYEIVELTSNGGFVKQ